MASRITCIFSILLLSAGTGSARADFTDGKLPDGSYHCEVYLLGMFLSLGDITIKGNVYTGPVTFGTAPQAYNYQMDAKWRDHLAGPVGRLHDRRQLDLADASHPGRPNQPLLRHHHEAA